jgi:hypothetical protein
MLNAEKISEHKERARREYEEKMRADAQAEREQTRAQEDPQLAAYNDHLAQLSNTQKKRLWGH